MYHVMQKMWEGLPNQHCACAKVQFVRTILLISTQKGCVSRADKRFSKVKMVSLLCCRSDHVVPQCFSHVLVGNQRRMETVQLYSK